MRIAAYALIGLVILVVVVGAGLVIALNTVDLARFQNLASDQVEKATGRTLVIDGELNVAISLRPTLVVEGIRFANTPGAAEPDMARIARLEAQVQLMPLLRGEVRLDRLIIVDPQITLETDAEGRGNWTFGPLPASPDAGADGLADDKGDESPLGFLAGLGEARIEGGEIVYAPAGAAPIHIALDRVVVRTAGPNAPLELEAQATWDGEAFNATVTTASLETLAENYTDLPMTVKATGIGATLRGEGRLTQDGVDMAIDLSAEDLSPLKSRFGIAIASDGPLQIAGQLAAGPLGIRLTGATVRLGTSDLAGDIAVALDGERPTIDANLHSGRLDLADFTAPAPQQAAGGGPAADAANNGTGRVLPNDPLPFALLESVDANVALAVADFRMPGMTLTDIDISVALSDGDLDADIPSLTLAGGGTIRGAITVNATEATVQVDLNATQVALAGLTRGALSDAVEGTVDIEVALTGHGRTPAEIAANLDGGVSVLMGEGRAKAQVLDSVVGGVSTLIGTLFTGDSDWTVVNCAAANFAIEGGVATSQVLLFDSAAATVAGQGTLDLRTEALDFVVTPQAKVATLNVSTPVLVQGTLADPSFAPDPLAVARKVGGILGIFIFPPAAVAGLGELGRSDNPCLQLAAEPRIQDAPVEDAPALEIPGVPEGIGNAIEDLGRGLQNLLGR